METPRDSYPYETYHQVIDKILERDRYTCQICGFYGVKSVDGRIRACMACERIGFHFSPHPEWRPPKKCPSRSTIQFCGNCPEFREFSIEYVSYEGLVVHHKNGDKKDQDPENLVTLCVICHRHLHHRDGVIPWEEAREHIQGSLGPDQDVKLARDHTDRVLERRDRR